MSKDKIKGFFSGAMAMMLVIMMSLSAYAMTGSKTITVNFHDVKIYVDQKLIAPRDANGNGVEPFIFNGTTYVPVRAVSEALGKKVSWDGPSRAVYIEDQSIVQYQNREFGFRFSLPETWKGYSLVAGEWEGTGVEGDNAGRIVETGPLLSIRHPLWTNGVPRQDIPILVFTYSQWDAVQMEKLSLGAAPIGPSELGRNNQYVFALPARYNYSFPAGFEEVEQILQGNPLQALPLS